MTPEPEGGATPSEIGRAISEVTEYSQRILREEIELAKAEVTEKITKLAKGAAVGAAAGVFVLAGLIYFLHALSWFIWQGIRGDSTDNFYLGFLIVAVGLFVVAGIAGFLAYRFIKGGAPPTPKMAIDEAQKVRQTISGAGRP
ncbi:MAG: phage holin family protein [Solirubrobacteraceae bacterium]